MAEHCEDNVDKSPGPVPEPIVLPGPLRNPGSLDVGEIQRLLGEWVFASESHRLRAAELERIVLTMRADAQELEARLREADVRGPRTVPMPFEGSKRRDAG